MASIVVLLLISASQTHSFIFPAAATKVVLRFGTSHPEPFRLCSSRHLTCLQANGPDSPRRKENMNEGSTYSFFEGATFYQSARDEVEAMGGDPFFLPNDVRQDDEGSSDGLSRPRNMTSPHPEEDDRPTREEVEAMGGDPFFL